MTQENPPEEQTREPMRSEWISDGGIVFTMESYGLNDPTVTISSENATSIVIPVEYVKAFLEYSKSEPLSRHIVKGKLAYACPIKYGAVKAPGHEDIYTPQGLEYTEPGTPFIMWFLNGMGQEDSEPEYALSIQGLFYKIIMKAKWNDVEGVRNLVELMLDSKRALTIAALTSPEEAKMLTSTLNANAILEDWATKSLPGDTYPCPIRPNDASRALGITDIYYLKREEYVCLVLRKYNGEEKAYDHEGFLKEQAPGRY